MNSSNFSQNSSRFLTDAHTIYPFELKVTETSPSRSPSQSAHQDMPTSTALLPSRAYLVSNLHRLRLPIQPTVNGICHGCSLPLAVRSIDCRTETAIRLPCGHDIGERCARAAYNVHSTCPFCKVLLCYDVPDDDELTNLQRIVALQYHSREHGRNDDKAQEQMFYNASLQLIKDCGDAFWSNDNTIRPAEYALFRQHGMLIVGQLNQRHRILDARVLVDALMDKFDEAFLKATLPVLKSLGPSEPDLDLSNSGDKLMAPSHPLAAKFLGKMIDVIWRYNGRACSATQLYNSPTQLFNSSELNVRLHQLDYFGACPHGFKLCHRLMTEEVVRVFVSLPPIPVISRDEVPPGTYGHRKLPVVSRSRTRGESGDTDYSTTMPIPIPRQSGRMVQSAAAARRAFSRLSNDDVLDELLIDLPKRVGMWRRLRESCKRNHQQ